MFRKMTSHSLILFWLIVVILFSPLSNAQSLQLSATVPGDIILGGLVPVRVNQNGKCGDSYQDKSMQSVEMMFFALDEINKRQDLLPNITLGINIFDTCNIAAYALEQCLEFIRTTLPNNDATCMNRLHCQDGSLPLLNNYTVAPIRGIVDGSINYVTTKVSHLLNMFSIPMISYTSTNAQLSDKAIHPFFARTSPSQTKQTRVMAALVKHFNWKFISTVRSSGEYGDSGIAAFQKEVENTGACISTNQVIPTNPTEEQMDQIVQTLKEYFPRARVVVLYTRSDDTKRLLDTVRKLNVTNKFVWIGSSGWGQRNMPVRENEAVADGALTIEAKSTFIPAFTEYFKALHPSTNIRNPWFRQYWEQLLDCSLTSDSYPCPGEILPEGAPLYEIDSSTSFVYQAIYAFAESLSRIQQRECLPRNLSLSGCVELLRRYSSHELYNLIVTSTFDNGHANTVKFDHNGDAMVQYNIYNYNHSPHNKYFEYKLVAEFKEDNLHFVNDITWPGSTQTVPTSQCSEPCKSGQIKLSRSKHSTCCWICQTCNKNQYVENGIACVDCKDGEIPTQDRTACYNPEEPVITQPTETEKEIQSNKKDADDDDANQSTDTDVGGG